MIATRVVMGRDSSGLKFLVQKYIRLESSLFRIQPLDFLGQNVGPFTTPDCNLHNCSCVLASYGTIVLFECFEQSRQPNTVRRYCSIFLQTELLNSRPKVANCLECSSAIFASILWSELTANLVEGRHMFRSPVVPNLSRSHLIDQKHLSDL